MVTCQWWRPTCHGFGFLGSEVYILVESNTLNNMYIYLSHFLVHTRVVHSLIVIHLYVCINSDSEDSEEDEEDDEEEEDVRPGAKRPRDSGWGRGRGKGRGRGSGSGKGRITQTLRALSLPPNGERYLSTDPTNSLPPSEG